MRDEIGIQTEKSFYDTENSLKDALPRKRSIEIDDFESEDEYKIHQMRPSMQAKLTSNQDEHKSGGGKGRTTPQNEFGRKGISDTEKQMDDLTNSNSAKKSTIFSMEKGRENVDNPYLIKIPENLKREPPNSLLYDEREETKTPHDSHDVQNDV